MFIKIKPFGRSTYWQHRPNFSIFDWINQFGPHFWRRNSMKTTSYILYLFLLLAPRDVAGLSDESNNTEEIIPKAIETEYTDGFTDEDIIGWDLLDASTCTTDISFQTPTPSTSDITETCTATLSYDWNVCCQKRPDNYHFQARKRNVCATPIQESTISNRLITIVPSASLQPQIDADQTQNIPSSTITGQFASEIPTATAEIVAPEASDQSISETETSSSASDSVPSAISPASSDGSMDSTIKHNKEIEESSASHSSTPQDSKTSMDAENASVTSSHSLEPTTTIEAATPVATRSKLKSDRFNYASFDCGALILDTNKEASSATSILVKNRDQYMLNKCAANKYVIVELCQEILVRGIAVANFEFFSSMFKTFHVYVSDRYPPKTNWVKVGSFTARNSRDIQEFKIENPVIWAKYLKIDFASHYGKEFYCPLSLLNVYGTSMLEDVRAVEQELHAGLSDSEDSVSEYKNDDIPPATNLPPISASLSTTSASESLARNNKTAAINDDDNIKGTDVDKSIETPSLPAPSSTLKDAQENSAKPSPPSQAPISTQRGSGKEDSVAAPLESVQETDKTFLNSSSTPSFNPNGGNETGSPEMIQTALPKQSQSNPTQINDAPPIPPLPGISAQESIFKTIMKRIQSLERNMTQLSREFAEQYAISPSFVAQIAAIRRDHEQLKEDVRYVTQKINSFESKMEGLLTRIDKIDFILGKQNQNRGFLNESLFILIMGFFGKWLIDQAWLLYSQRHSRLDGSMRTSFLGTTQNNSIPVESKMPSNETKNTLGPSFQNVPLRSVQSPLSSPVELTGSSRSPLSDVVLNRMSTGSEGNIQPSALLSPFTTRKSSKKRKRRTKQGTSTM